MSDERLRELERRWKETGTIGDEAAYLLERVRAGELTQEQLELAAYCGHAGAQEGLGPKESPGDLRSLLSGFLRFGGLGSRAACLAATTIVALSELGPESLAACELVAAWVVCPCSDHAQHVREALSVGLLPQGTEITLVPACLEVCVDAMSRRRRKCIESAQLVVKLANTYFHKVPLAARKQTPDVLSECVRGAIIEWALWGEVSPGSPSDPQSM